MSDRDSDFQDDGAQALARLAALQRLQEQAKKGNRSSMLTTIEQMMEMERRALTAAKDTDAEPA